MFLCWVHIYLSSFIDPLIMYFPSCLLITVFILKSISSGMSIAMPAFLSLHLHGIPLFHPPHMVLMTKLVDQVLFEQLRNL